MPTLNASGKVIAVSEEDDKVLVTVESSRKDEAGTPSFKLTYEFPSSSPAVAAYPLDTVVALNITTTPPAVQAPDVVTSTTSLESAAAPAPEPIEETPVVGADVPAVPAAGFANTDIDSIKDALGIPGGSSSGPAPTTGIITPS